jgi:hypothetical protein
MLYFHGKRRRETHDLPDEQEDTDPNKAGSEEDDTTDDACMSIMQSRLNWLASKQNERSLTGTSLTALTGGWKRNLQGLPFKPLTQPQKLDLHQLTGKSVVLDPTSASIFFSAV